ncbi:STAS domain-containing protein [Streptomyces sp. NPDC005547]|uniref:STAS domain-containing protein n=1 Tax=Streptomyces sp. NPDC005547 TaxID=3154887 RepID=UPI0033AA9722
MNTEPAAVVVLPDHLTRADVPRLCAELRAALAASPTATPACDVSAAVHPDLTTIEALARLTLVTRRAGARLRLRGTPPELRALLDLVGLGEMAGEPGEAGAPPGEDGADPPGAGAPAPASRRSATE